MTASCTGCGRDFYCQRGQRFCGKACRRSFWIRQKQSEVRQMGRASSDRPGLSVLGGLLPILRQILELRYLPTDGSVLLPRHPPRTSKRGRLQEVSWFPRPTRT